MVICNLQNTPLDEVADLRIYAKADDFMEKVMGKLGCPIPPFVLRRKLVVKGTVDEDGRFQMTVSGVDVDGTPVSFLRSVRCINNRRLVRSEPFKFHLRGSHHPREEIKLDLEFMGHYGEPSLEVAYQYTGKKTHEVSYSLDYNALTRIWSVGIETVS